MQIVTTNSIDGKQTIAYLGIVSAEVIFGANFVKEILGANTDFYGGRSGTYEREFAGARDAALKTIESKARSMNADAVVGSNGHGAVLLGVDRSPDCGAP